MGSWVAKQPAKPSFIFSLSAEVFAVVQPGVLAVGTFDAPAQLDELLHVLLAGIPGHPVWVQGFRVKG